jgi:hypothetical protein
LSKEKKGYGKQEKNLKKDIIPRFFLGGGKGDFTVFYMKNMISTYMQDLLLKIAQICCIL